MMVKINRFQVAIIGKILLTGTLPFFFRAFRRSKFCADGWLSIGPLDRSPYDGKISASLRNEGQHRTRHWNAICANKPGKGIAVGNRSLEDGWTHS
jgi:hypothetical protein